MCKVTIWYQEQGQPPASTEVAALVVEGGLAVTEIRGGGWWTVTHVGSGHSVGAHSFLSSNDARTLLRELLPLADWTQPMEAILPLPGIGPKVAQIARDLAQKADNDIHNGCLRGGW